MGQQNQNNIQWFPGHMAKTERMISKYLPLVDVVIELRDARIPFSSANPDISRLCGRKKRVILLNKADYADENITARWIEYFAGRGTQAFAADCKSGKGLNKLFAAVTAALSDELERRKAKGMAGQPIRMMVVGIPNVGKSSFINRVASGKRTRAEDRPGVTRGIQWVDAGTGFELLDMPGILWHKFDDQTIGERLAFTGAVKDQILDVEYLAMRLLELLKEEYPQRLTERYRIDPEEYADGYDLLEGVARARGMLMSGGRLNTERAAGAVLDEFRGGMLGRITLETPPKGV